ncbi:uncharacterized protein MONOS_5507 [Monocercomonoides exilis]|uniref:uncharacterized protein n=1 Tax=Monocercomonoides exilis TaxID=2049356 RepID=UPI00355A1576|nr:hypothetical protein MONOS_5507 [Monocercomonoides exilis]|eukprot:MONOS_5507.1-p1 / transcript=MONOS_5507.1 / gene=MONOS_5507 / organism=Monocercomonoides_exilis_PA203 / gene_product=unspecified product / transcript_product=unspecified product / location=Mono_scaffold00161:74763-77489(-) / protein_length=908 / sequence_SO=supercontig / SO=protein_coding / is_pseudo=false
MKRKKEQGFNHISGKDTVNSDILLKSYYSETAGKSKIKSEFLVSFAEIDSLTQAFAALPESIGQNIESPPATSAECAPEQTDNEKAEQTDNEKAEQGENRDEGNPFTSTSSEQSANQSTFSTLPSSHTHIHSFSPSISSFASLDPASIPPLVFPSALFSARISQLQQHVSHQLCGAMLLHTPLQDLFSAAWDFFFLRKGALFAAFFEALDKNQWETLFLRQSQREAALRERERKEEEEKIKEKDGMDKILNAQNKEDPESLAKRREARQNAELTQKKRRELVDCLEMCWSSAVGMCGMDELAVRNKKGREEWKGEDGEFDEEEEEEEDNDEDDLDSNDDNTRQNVVFFEDWKGDTIRSRSKMDSTITLRNHSFHSTPKQTLIPHSLFAPVLIASVFSQTNTNRSVSQPQSAKQKQSTFLLPSIPPCLRSFNAITLSFTPPFPLSLFFTPSALSIYSTAFRFLFCLSKARLNLRRVWTEKVRLFAKPSSKVEQTKLQRDKMKEKNVFFDAELLARDEAMEKTRKAVLAEVSRAHSLLSFVLNNLSVYFSEGVIGNICQAMQNEMFPANQRKNAVDELLERESGGDVEESEKKGGIIKKDESAMEIDYDHTFTPTPLRRSSSSILTTSFRSSPSSSPSYSPFSTPSRVPSSHPESDYRTETDSDSQSSSSLDFLSVMFSHEKGLMKIQTQLFLSSPSVSRSISSLIDCSEQFVSALAEFDASVFQKDRANDALREEEKKRWIKGGTQIGLKDGSQYLQSTSSLSQLSDPFMTASLSFTSQSTTLSERSSRFPSSIASPSTHTLQAFSRLLNRIRPIVSSFIHQLQLFYRLISAICSSFNLSVKQQTSSSSLSSLSQSPSFQSTSSAHFTSNASKENVSQNVSSIEIAHPMLKDLLDRLNFNGWITKLEEI